jgi:uracil-DNA glycosylase
MEQESILFSILKDLTSLQTLQTNVLVMNVKISPHWQSLLKNEFEKPYFKLLAEKVRSEYLTHTVFPAPKKCISHL